MEKRKGIEASAGHIITNGVIYCHRITLAEGLSYDGFYEITKAEYEAIMEAMAAEAAEAAEASEEDEEDEADDPDRATEEDYQQALRDMGVSV